MARPSRPSKNFARTLKAHIGPIAHRRRIEIWFQDEARIGQKNGLVRQWAWRGTRPTQPADQRYESAYLQVEAVNVTVAIGEARVCPRDIVVADANGGVVVPRGRAREVAELARSIEGVETQIRERIAKGDSIGEARAALGCHKLQRRNA